MDTGEETIFILLLLLLCPLDPEDSCRGKLFSTPALSVQGGRRAVYDTGTDPSRKTSLYRPVPVWVPMRDATRLGQFIPYCLSSPHLLPILGVDHVLTALFKPLNLQSLCFFCAFNFVLLLEYATLDIPLGHNFRKDAVHSSIFT